MNRIKECVKLDAGKETKFNVSKESYTLRSFKKDNSN